MTMIDPRVAIQLQALQREIHQIAKAWSEDAARGNDAYFDPDEVRATAEHFRVMARCIDTLAELLPKAAVSTVALDLLSLARTIREQATHGLFLSAAGCQTMAGSLELMAARICQSTEAAPAKPQRTYDQAAEIQGRRRFRVLEGGMAE